MRRNKTIDQLFQLFATPSELQEVDMLYDQHSKGVAVHKQLRRIYASVTELMEKKRVNRYTVPAVEKRQFDDDFDIPMLRLD